jgi:hypothetical protein
MRPTDVIIRETYEQNRRAFSHKDRAHARTAFGIYRFEIHGAGLRWEFDYPPRKMGELMDRPQRHLTELESLKARARQFGEFIRLLEKFRDRPAVQLNPEWYTEGATETITRTLDPEAAPAYRAFHAALVAYLDELGKKKPDWSKVADLIRQVAYTVAPDEWREAGATASGRSLTDFNADLYLEAILDKPRESTG